MTDPNVVFLTERVESVVAETANTVSIAEAIVPKTLIVSEQAVTVIAAATQGPPGPKGDTGTAGPNGSMIYVPFGSAASAGQPIALDPATGKAMLASAANYALALCTGFAFQDAQENTTGQIVVQAQFEMPDWTLVCGAMYLKPGASYFLSETPGMITTTAPNTRGSSVTAVGQALSFTTLDIGLNKPILL